MKKYDVILYGASGFTGKQAVAYFKENAPENLRWAIAGRNSKKLKQVSKDLGIDVPIEVSDALDQEGIGQMVQKTNVILTTAGPFALYGSHLVASCAKHGVHYVDITGEAPWVRDMLEQHGEQAQESGAKIIPFCGFDSIPADLGVWFLQKHFRSTWQTELNQANGYYTLARGGLNGGTLLSALNMMEKGEAARLANPKLLLKDLDKRDFIPKIKRQWMNQYAEDIDKWVYPFVMAEINTKVVYRSIGLAIALDLPHPNSFLYQEYHAIGKRIPSIVASCGIAAFAVLGQFGPMRTLIKKLGPKSNEGPSKEEREKGFFRLKIIGEDAQQHRAMTTLSFQGDAGNKATVTFLSECALALAQDEEKLPNYSGFLTPTVGLGDVLLERLKAAGLAIDCQTLD